MSCHIYCKSTLREKDGQEDFLPASDAGRPLCTRMVNYMGQVARNDTLPERLGD